jgi:hypothetical protein
MFIDIWNKENKAIKINKFSKDLISNDNKIYHNAVFKILKDYGVIMEESYVNTYYYIHFYNKDDDDLWFNEMLYFSTLFDCFTFMLSDVFEYLFESEGINFIKITAGKQVMFKYDDRG